MPKQNKNLSKVLIISLVFIGLTFSLAVRSLTAGGVGIRPAYPDPNDRRTRSWFIYNLEPGQSKEDGVIVSNGTGREATAIIYAVDSKLSNDGGFALAMENEEKKGVGAWIRFFKEEELAEKEEEGEVTEEEIKEAEEIETEEVEKIELDLEPDEERLVRFIIRVPEDADVGEHSGGIIIQGKSGERVEGGAAVVTRVGARIYETVPGEIIRKLVLSKFDVLFKEGKYVLTFSIKNEGNVSLVPDVDIFVNDTLFHKKDQVFSRKPQVSRGSEIGGSFEWEKPKWKIFNYFGKFLIQAKITYAKNGEIETIKSEPIIVWLIPWLEISVFSVIILIILIILAMKLTLARKERKRMKEYTVGSRETIETIAEKFGMKWKKLAKINKLKPPYTLRKGQKILIVGKKIIKKTKKKTK